MKRTSALASVITSTMVLLLAIGVNVVQSQEKMMGNDMMMKQGDTMIKNGQMMMDQGK
jgi:hypothetical protein